MNYTATYLNFKESLFESNQITTEDKPTFDKMNLSSFIINPNFQKTLKNNGVLYFTLPSKVTVEDITYNTYGIGAIKNNVIVDYVLDLSTDFESVKSFVNLCNINELSLIHLRDATEDFFIQ